MMQVQPFTAQREWTVEGIPVLSAAVSGPQPVPAADRLTRRIRRYYQTQCRAYLRYCEHCLLPQAEQEYRAALASSAPLPLFRAELTYQITYHDDRFLSLYTQSVETGGSQPLRTRRGDTWDLTAGYPVPLSTFFPDRSRWKRQLLELAAAEILRQERAGIAQYHPHWRKRLRRAFNPKNYYLTSEGMAFFFPMYALAPAAEGIPTFLLPYSGDRPAPAFPQETAPEHPPGRLG